MCEELGDCFEIAQNFCPDYWFLQPRSVGTAQPFLPPTEDLHHLNWFFESLPPKPYALK